MLDLVGALFAGSYFTTLVVVLVWGSGASLRHRLTLTGALGGWIATVLTLAQGNTRIAGAWGRGPWALALLAILLASVPTTPWPARLRNALALRDPRTLIGLHALRLGGVFFLLLVQANRIPPLFAWTAGVGDIVTGAVALGLALRLARGLSVSRRIIWTWNVFGGLDLALALGTAVLARTRAGAGMQTMTTIPWVLIPTAIVPVILLTHLAIAAQLGREATSAPPPAPRLGPRTEDRNEPEPVWRDSR